MPRNEGHINYALVEKSARLQRVVDLLKRADHPLSGMEIQVQAWVTNASTSIDEIRKGRNAEAGYAVSPATKWKGGALPWHDGLPRYWLLTAPGWSPRWTVTKEGVLVPYTAYERHEPIAPRSHEDTKKGEEEQERMEDVIVQDPGPRLCRFQMCRKPLPADADERQVFCSDACKDGYWRLIREIGKRAAGAG